MNEKSIISKYLAPLAKNHPAALELKDDAAIISPKSNTQIVISTDSITEGAHFPEGTSAENIAKKLIGSNLSDLAAMAAKPQFAMISAILPKDIDETWIQNFCLSAERIINTHNIALIGGDTVKHNGSITFSMTIIGEVDKYKAVQRNGANVGDDVYVTGTIGDATIGLDVVIKNRFNLDRASKVYFENKYFAPEPKNLLGQKLSGIASSMTDISDGLLLDGENISSSSNVELRLQKNKIPFSKHLQELMKNHDLFEQAITGGDDYELLFTAPKIFHNQITSLSKSCNTKVTKIGTVASGNSIKIFDIDNKECSFKSKGYSH